MSKIEKRDKKRKKSSCWLFYTKRDRGGICRLCQKVILSNGNTTNLLNHLKRKHKLQFEAATEENDDDSVIDTEMDFEVKEDQEVNSTELHRATEETNHTQGLAYQSSDGQTVIWLHPDVQLDQLSSVLKPQMTVLENGEEATVGGSGDFVLKEDISMEEFIQKEEDTMSGDEVVQKADTTGKDYSLVLNTEGEVIQQDHVYNIGNVAQIVTVSSSEDLSTEDNPVSSSPSKIMTNIYASKKTYSKPKKSPSSLLLGNSTNTTSSPKKTVVATHYKAIKPKPPKSEWASNNTLGQTLVSGIVQIQSSEQSSVSTHSSGGCDEQSSAENSGKQKSVDSSVRQNNTCSCGRENKSSRKQYKSSKSQREDAFDHFGKYIATLLRDLPSKKSATKLQKEILSWVLKEKMTYED